MRQQSPVMQKVFPHGKEGDAVSCSTDTSRWSSPSRSDDSYIPQYTFECEDKADASPSVKWQSGRKPGVLFGKKAQGVHTQKTDTTRNHHVVKLPPIKSPQISKSRMQSASLNRIRELESEVCSLQQQLCESRTENKLLKRVQHRHTMALQYYQDSKDSISQIVTKHKNEARALQKLLRNTRTCRDNLARQLQATEDKLLHTKEILQQLQLLIQDQSLQEREELTLRLAKASAEVEEKDKKILDMEKNLELCQASFKRQIVTEQRKIKEARKISSYLQGQIDQLTKELVGREREMEKHNIYFHRFLKGLSNRGRENKMVQTDGLVPLPADGASVLENEYSEPVQRLEQQESSVTEKSAGRIAVQPKAKKPKMKKASESTSVFDASEPTVKDLFSDTCSDESPENKNNGDCVKEKKASEALHVFEEKQEAEHERMRVFILEQSLNPAAPEKRIQVPRI
ncbi:lebercilin-like protein [Archocentrus centrarchus]|uniref:lebercilin-like protein n=1 Tax=Archocentrus centrarchus TaxID=63155 RepID=UPI0011E9CB1F|nr:lebercilin-like protein [Archocentrus centrarchus]